MSGVSGIFGLDEILQGIRLGDNVVWQVDTLEDYRHFAGPFADEALAQGRHLVYLRFAQHEPVLDPMHGLEVLKLDPASGFEVLLAKSNKSSKLKDGIGLLCF